MAVIPPLEVTLNGGATDRKYVVGDPITIDLKVNDKIKFCAEGSSFSVVIDGSDGFFNPPQLWPKFIPEGECMTTPEIRLVDPKVYSVLCINNGDYHGQGSTLR